MQVHASRLRLGSDGKGRLATLPAPTGTRNGTDERSLARVRRQRAHATAPTDAAWHAAGANRTAEPRVGLACSYIPWYLGRVTMDLVPIAPEVHAALRTEQGRALTRHMLGWQSTGHPDDILTKAQGEGQEEGGESVLERLERENAELAARNSELERRLAARM